MPAEVKGREGCVDCCETRTIRFCAEAVSLFNQIDNVLLTASAPLFANWSCSGGIPCNTPFPQANYLLTPAAPGCPAPHSSFFRFFRHTITSTKICLISDGFQGQRVWTSIDALLFEIYCVPNQIGEAARIELEVVGLRTTGACLTTGIGGDFNPDGLISWRRTIIGPGGGGPPIDVDDLLTGHLQGLGLTQSVVFPTPQPPCRNNVALLPYDLLGV